MKKKTNTSTQKRLTILNTPFYLTLTFLTTMSKNGHTPEPKKELSGVCPVLFLLIL
ncbi:hypothetical protein [Bacillus sp. TH50]|uniref:hypothetical protein n=1 Tax=Bacillus sp. TH50 TaxID=2796414 RepID=UPI001A92952F|nr:hypothetical protein [Bacillus sp. TH50]